MCGTFTNVAITVIDIHMSLFLQTFHVVLVAKYYHKECCQQAIRVLIDAFTAGYLSKYLYKVKLTELQAL